METMVLILDSNWEKGAHVRSNFLFDLLILLYQEESQMGFFSEKTSKVRTCSESPFNMPCTMLETSTNNDFQKTG